MAHGKASDGPILLGVLDAVPQAVVAFDDDLRLVAVNRRFVELLSLPPELGQIGTPFADFIRYNAEHGVYGDVDPDAAVRYWGERIRAPDDSVEESVRPDGTVVEIQKTRMPGGFVLAYVDVTERKQRERELEEQTRHLEAILAHMTQGVNIVDPDGRVILANTGFLELFAFPPEFSARGTPVEAFVRHRLSQGARYHDEPARADLETLIRQRVEHLRFAPSGQEQRHLPDGRVIEIQRIRLESGVVISTFTDVTERVLEQAALASSEARMTAIVQDQTELVCRFDHNYCLTFVNQAYCRLFGVERGQVIGKSFLPWLDEVTRTALLADLKELTPEQPITRRTDERRLWNGEALYFDWTNRALFNARGDLIEYQAVGRDITALKRIEAGLRASEARLRAVVEDQSEMICRFDSDFRLTFVNSAYVAAFGSERTLLGRSILELVVDPDDRREIAEGLKELTPAQPMRIGEYHERLADGRMRWQQWANRGTFDAAGKVIEYQAVGRDVTERREAEEALRESEARLRSIAEAHPIPLLIVDLETGSILHASPASVPLLGDRLEAIVGGNGFGLLAEVESRDAFAALVRGHPAVDGFEAEIAPPGHEPMPVAITARWLTYEGRRAVVLGLVDLREWRRAEAEIDRQRQALYQSEKLSAMGSLLASVAHELNNPLSVVVGQSTILEELAEGTPAARRATKIREAANRCARIVRTFLAMARSKPPSRAVVNLNDVISAALELTAYNLRSSGVEVVAELHDGLPDLWADGDQLHQVLVNLIINANQAMQETAGPRQLRVATGYDSGVTRITLTVMDTGPGISADVGDRIFEPFFTTKPAGVGTGIGLSVSRKAVAAHGGELTVANRPEGGAVFRVGLPVTTADGAGMPVEAEVAAVAGGRVLIVDDEPEIAETLAEILQSNGIPTEVAHGGREAFERMTTRSYGLIICDLRMPDLDGRGLYRLLKSERPEMAGRMMFITGDALAADLVGFVNDSGVAVIEKPFDAQRIRRTIVEQLARLGEQPGSAPG